MTNESSGPQDHAARWEFLEQPASAIAENSSEVFVVRVPIGISRKQSLFHCFAEALRFPGYFGGNWDALRDCLFDLSWLSTSPRQILIVHDDLPFVPGQRDLAIYLSILEECCRTTSLPAFRVIFPKSRQTAVIQSACG